MLAWRYHMRSLSCIAPAKLQALGIGALLICWSIPVRGQDLPVVSSSERQIYEAIFNLMDHIPREEPHVTVFGVTLNSKCGQAAYPAPLFNDCTFLWAKPDTAEMIERLLRDRLPDLKSDTWSDFVAKNRTSAVLKEPLATPWMHRLIAPGDDASKDWDSPDMTIFLSRVGFSRNQDEAVVYALVFSYLDNVSTAGDYFIFRRARSGDWEPKGRVTYLEKEKDQSGQWSRAIRQ